jgi:hypothetical protein
MSFFGKQIQWSTQFESLTRYDYVAPNGNGAGTSVVATGAKLCIGNTNPGGQAVLDDPYTYNGYGVVSRNPEFYAVVAIKEAGGTRSQQTWDSYVVAGFLGSPHNATYGQAHFGFRFSENSGVITIQATCGPGVAPFTPTQTTIVPPTGDGTNTNTYYAKMISGDHIDFYINGTLVATHTTSLPDPSQAIQPFGSYIYADFGSAPDYLLISQAGFAFDQ